MRRDEDMMDVVPENAWRRLDHPELLPGEVFVTNAKEGALKERSRLRKIRMGVQAYDMHGRHLDDELFPYFAEEEERNIYITFYENIFQ